MRFWAICTGSHRDAECSITLLDAAFISGWLVAHSCHEMHRIEVRKWHQKWHQKGTVHEWYFASKEPPTLADYRIGLGRVFWSDAPIYSKQSKMPLSDTMHKRPSASW